MYSRRNLFVPSSDWITFHTIVSTSADQIAIAPGYLQRTWKQDNRNYYEYSMGSTHIADFFAFLSARYATRKEVYNGPNGPVNLEVYYYPTHTYDIDDMLASSRAGSITTRPITVRTSSRNIASWSFRAIVSSRNRFRTLCHFQRGLDSLVAWCIRTIST